MTDAPDRIWIDEHGGNWSPVSGGTQENEYTRADLHTAAMERAYIAGLEAAAVVADTYHSTAVKWATKVRGLSRLIDETDSSRIAKDARALKDPAHVRDAVAKLTEGRG
jgi:hypothetical protein